MDHYHFDLHERDVITPDYEGRGFDTLEAARSAAILDARSMMQTEVCDGHLCMTTYISIRIGQDEIAIVTFGDALRIS